MKGSDVGEYGFYSSFRLVMKPDREKLTDKVGRRDGRVEVQGVHLDDCLVFMWGLNPLHLLVRKEDHLDCI